MYADFESILELMDPVEPGSPNPNQPYTNKVNQHTPSGWCDYRKFAYGDVDNLRELGGHASDMEVIAKNKEDYISFSIKVPVEKYIDKEGNEKIN